MSVNVETAKNDEAVVLRYWNDVISDNEAERLAASIAQALNSFLNESDQRVAEFNPAQNSVPRSVQRSEMVTVPPTPKERSRATSPLQRPDMFMERNNESFYEQSMIGSSPDLRKVVDSCVREVIQQMLQSGTLQGGAGFDMSDLMDRKIAEVLDQRQPTAGSNLGKNQELESFSPYRMKQMLDLPTASTDSYHALDYNPKEDTDGRSMAAQIRRRGRSAVIEKKLLALWSSMLEMDEDSITPEDSFFELGGDSLTAMRLVGAAREEGLAVTVADVFRNPVFEDMVAMIRVASMISAYEEEDEDADAEGELTEYGRGVPILRTASKRELYQRFSLVKATNIDAFLQSNICPKVGVFRGGIADVLPVTDFQGLAITGSLLESKWMLNYFFLDGNGPVDLKQLKLSVFRVVQTIDVLRTVFLPHGDRFLQVVLRKMRPDFHVYETESNMDEFTSMLQQRDREQGPRLGEPFFNFTVVRQKDSDYHRMIIRISHAQYDGVCLPKIFMALQSAYLDEPLPTMASFTNYVRTTASTITSDHYQHWRTLLKGSRMTDIVRRHGPNYRRSAGSTTQLKQTILLAPIAHGSITTATVVKAAWALVLAQLSGRSDVVFGHTISGRNATIAGVESTVGPCLNIVPVRVQFCEDWTALDLLRLVQDQQVSNMPYEALGFREITKHCTEWPDWTNFTTVVQHQNVSYGSEMEFGGNMYKVGGVGADEDFADFSVISTPKGSDQCELTLSFSLNGDITAIFAQKVLNMLCNVASDFTANPNSPLMSPGELNKLPPQVIDETSRPNDNYFVSSQLQELNRADLLVLSDVLSRAWRQVLGDENTNGLNLESSFFDLNGDIMGLAQVSWLLEQEGFRVRIEDLIDHPTMLGQMAAMCASKAEHTKTCPSMASLIDDESSVPPTPTTPVPKTEKKSWLKAMGKARKMVKRNTRSS